MNPHFAHAIGVVAALAIPGLSLQLFLEGLFVESLVSTIACFGVLAWVLAEACKRERTEDRI